MANDPSNERGPTPEITPELAEQLVREGERAASEYRKRMIAMWTISPENRQARTR